MSVLVLSEAEQVAMRGVIAGEPVPEVALGDEGPLRHLARLIASDAMGIALLDATGSAVGETALHGRRTNDEAPPWTMSRWWSGSDSATASSRRTAHRGVVGWRSCHSGCAGALDRSSNCG